MIWVALTTLLAAYFPRHFERAWLFCYSFGFPIISAGMGWAGLGQEYPCFFFFFSCFLYHRVRQAYGNWKDNRGKAFFHHKQLSTFGPI